MDINISFRNKSKEDLLKFLNVLQKEIKKMEDKEIKNIYNAGNFIIFGVDGNTVIITASI
nr:hypothetical protein [Helcococcus sueciensis]